MKNLKKILGGALVAVAAFGFFGCSDEPEEDENLVVSITGNQNIVTIAAPDEYDGQDVKIVYTLDGTEPVVKLTDDKTDVTVTGTAYESPFEISENVTVKARGYYYDSAKKSFYQGPVAEKSVTYSDDTKVTTAKEAEGTSTGDFEFSLASTGNSNTVHYFDTSASNVFKYSDDYPNAYYQIQFTWKGSGKGTWYLYMRDVNNGLIKKSNGSTAFLAKGTYTGACFDASDGSVANGKLTLTNNDSTTGSVTITENKKFTLHVNNSGAATSETATETLGEFTVSDAK